MGGNRLPRKTVKKHKELGRVAQASIIHNYNIVEKYLSDVKERKATRYRLARVEKAYGGGSFDVEILGESGTIRASLRKLMQGRGKFHHNPEVTTAARVGGYVLVEDIGLGHMASGTAHQIMGVLNMAQAARAMAALGIKDEKGHVGNYNFENAEVANLVTNLAEMGITPMYIKKQNTLRKGTTGGGATGGGAKSATSGGGAAGGGAGRSSSSSRKSSSSHRSGSAWRFF